MHKMKRILWIEDIDKQIEEESICAKIRIAISGENHFKVSKSAQD